METSYHSLISQEQAKIALLKAKIAECEKRIQVLRSMANADDLDNVLSKSVAHEASPTSNNQRGETALTPSPSGLQAPKKKLSKSVLSLLNYIGADGKTLDELETFSDQEGLKLDRGALRSFASTYRIKYGFLHSSRKGHVQLTERGQQYVKSLRVVSQNETPPASTGGVSSSTQAAVTGGTESDELL